MIQYLLPAAIVAAAAWVWSRRGGNGNGNGNGDDAADDSGDGDGGNGGNGDGNGNGDNGQTADPEDTLSAKQRIELSTFLSGLGYPATIGSSSIPYSTRMVWVLDFRTVRNRVREGKIARVWPLGSPGKQRRVVKGLSSASLAAARWAYSSQAAGVAWQGLVEQARSL